MTTKVELWNMALGHIRAAPVQSDVETSVPAQYCRQFYQVCLDEALMRSPWTFSTAWTPLAEIVLAGPSWAHAYAIPSGFLRIWGVSMEGDGVPSTKAAFSEPRFSVEYAPSLGARVILTQMPVSAAQVSYQVDVAQLPPDVVLMVSHLLARYLSIPLAGAEVGAKLMSDQNKLYEDAFRRATAIDATQRNLFTASVEQVTGRW